MTLPWTTKPNSAWLQLQIWNHVLEHNPKTKRYRLANDPEDHKFETAFAKTWLGRAEARYNTPKQKPQEGNSMDDDTQPKRTGRAWHESEATSWDIGTGEEPREVLGVSGEVYNFDDLNGRIVKLKLRSALYEITALELPWFYQRQIASVFERLGI